MSSFAGSKVNADPVVSIFVFNAKSGEVYLVYFKFRFVLEVLSKISIPLGAGDINKSTILKALIPLVPRRAVNSPKMFKGLIV